MRVDVYPTHRTVARAAESPRQHREERHRREDLRRRRRARERARRATRSRSRRRAPRRSGTTCCATTAWATTTAVRELEHRLGRRADAGGHRRRELGVADLRPEEDRTPINASDPFWLIKLEYIGPGAPRRRSAAVDRRRQPAGAAAPCLAIPAGPAPRQARAGPRLRHAEPRRGRRRHLRRRVGVQRRDRPLRLEARRQEGNVRSVQRLPG